MSLSRLVHIVADKKVYPHSRISGNTVTLNGLAASKIKVGLVYTRPTKKGERED